MGKRSPRDTTPPWQIIDWDTERYKAEIRAQNAKDPWWEKLEGEARADFFGEKEEEDRWWRDPPKRPGLPPEYGLPRLWPDERGKTLRAEGARFRELYNRLFDSGENYRVEAPQVIYDKVQATKQWAAPDDTYVPPESENPRECNGACTGGLTAEGARLLDALPCEPVVEEFPDDILGGEIWGLMKRSHQRRIARMRQQAEEEKYD